MSQVANANPLDTGSNANSVESAADDFTRMLQDEENPPRREPSKGRSPRSEPVPDETPEPEAPDTDPEADDDGHDPEGDEFLDGTKPKEGEEVDEDDDDNEDPDEDEDERGEDDDGELDLDKEVEVTVSGKVEKVKLSEVIAGYSREADYRAKTARVAEEYREVEQFAAETVVERQKYDAALQGWITMTAALMPSDADWAALEKADPATALATRKQWQAIEGKVAEAKAEQADIAKRAEADAARNYAKYVREQDQKLLDAVPMLRVPKKAAEFRNLIFAYGKAAGYSEDELMAGLVDHRDVLTAYKAARYDEIIRSRKAGQRPPKRDPKPASSSRPRSLGKNAGKSRSERDADRRLARSGSVEDAASAFSALIRN